MQVFTHGPVRSGMFRGLGRNQLIRTSDRVEAWVVVLVLGIGLLIAPTVATAAGAAFHDTRAQVYAEQARDRHEVPAVVLAPASTTARPYMASAAVRAEWSVDGHKHSGAVSVKTPAKAGERIDVWVDRTGQAVSAPAPVSQADNDGNFIAAATFVAVMAAAALVVAVLRRGLERGRLVAWDRDIRILLDDGRGRSNSTM